MSFISPYIDKKRILSRVTTVGLFFQRTRKTFSSQTHKLLWLGKMAKSLFIFLFFSFLFLSSWTYYTEGSVGKCHITWQEVTASHHMTSHDRSHDRHEKVVHRPCSNCISSVENLMGTLLSFLCQSLNKEQLALFWLGV